ncbi:MAG: PadR family transcriptional regulator [Candidatus Heimdallarchaeota archaeon]|nr:PadR family transcriptional regulator [Candidatus Heimdallarchaeota archaeon]
MRIAHTSFLGKSLSNLIILSTLIQHGTMNAYEILNVLTSDSEELIQPKAGTLYPQIENLSKAGLVNKELIENESKSTGRTREVAYFTISHDGMKYHQMLSSEWMRVADYIEKVIRGVANGN